MFHAALKAIRKQGASAILLVLAVLLTFTTTGVAAFKIAKSDSSNYQNVLGVSDSGKKLKDDQNSDKDGRVKNEEKINIGLKPSVMPSSSITNIKSAGVRANLTPSAIKPISSPPVANPNPQVVITQQSVQPAISSKCIITLFGQQYDVTTLRQTHSGGDVFKCGTDMTSVYQQKHGSNVAMVQSYLVSANSNSSNAQITQPSQQNPASQAVQNRKEEYDD
ncbi:MAG: hypothetical protein M1450_00480 [Patescibacteria group bacterium]|nr:hypothetical protein [Actinomycetota bacterium]MCL5969965.1 hypothetical protein [Patescibacteria group bacterium]